MPGRSDPLERRTINNLVILANDTVIHDGSLGRDFFTEHLQAEELLIFRQQNP